METPIATGSGVLLADGYLVTNAHVVDPYARADVTFGGGGESFADVPVVGIDAVADVAVLGPITTDRAGLVLEPVPDFEEEDEPEVFLVGFPGGIESDEPAMAIAGGLLSRLRTDETFELTYLQTDAAIAGGQSGGALVDRNGTVLGISGLGFAEEFALALSSDDVAAAVTRILDGDGDERRVMPSLDDAEQAAVPIVVTADHSLWTVVIPAADDDRDIELTVATEGVVAVEVTTSFGESIGVNGPGLQLARELATEFDDDTFADVEQLEEPEPGVLVFEAPAGDDIVASVTYLDLDAEVTLSADQPFAVFDHVVEGDAVTLDEPLRGTVDGFTYDVIHPVELSEGDRVEITVRGGTADMYFSVLAPGEDYDLLAEADADDGGGGLYDLDPSDTVRIDESGTWRIVIGSYDGVVSAYELEVRPDR